MLCRIPLALIASVALACSAQAAPAAPSAKVQASQRARPSEAEALAFVKAYSPSEVRREAELRMLRESFVSTLEKDEASAPMLKAFPELGPAMVKALESQIDLYMSEYDESFFPPATAVVREELSRDEVRALTEFYVSPLGRKILQNAARSIDGTKIAEKGLKGEDVDEALANRQMLASGWAVLASLSTTERDQMLAFTRSPVGERFFTAVVPKLSALQLKLLNTPGPKFTAASEKAMVEAFQRVTGIDPRKSK